MNKRTQTDKHKASSKRCKITTMTQNKYIDKQNKSDIQNTAKRHKTTMKKCKVQLQRHKTDKHKKIDTEKDYKKTPNNKEELQNDHSATDTKQIQR